MPDGVLLHPDSELALETFLQKPSHATLLSGPQGIGTSTIAVWLTSKLLGKEIAVLENAAYYRHIEPKDGTISIETIRSLNGFFRLSVPGSTTIKRVVVIDRAETMAGEAQNALLKLLEEPPAGTVLILVSSYPERLLPTIRSRLSRLMIPSPTKQQIVQWFTAKDREESDIKRTYLMAAGSIAAMLQLLGDGDTSPFDTVRTILGAKPFERLLHVESLSKDKTAASLFVASLTQAASASLDRAAQSPSSVIRWQHILEAGLTAQNALARNGNAKLVLTDLLLTL